MILHQALACRAEAWRKADAKNYSREIGKIDNRFDCR